MTGPRESPTKWQAQAYRFGVRRLTSAVASGDSLLRSDPLRRRTNISIIISVVIAALVLGVFAIIGVVHPDPSIGDASVVVDDDTGGAYVNRNGTLYPAMNLASALLAAGRGSNGNAAPSMTSVGTDTIAKENRGPLLGIAGAPNVLSHSLAQPDWTVCDTTTVNTALPPNSAPTVRTTAILGQPAPAHGGIGTDAMLVRAPGASTTFLLFDGRRAAIDPNDHAINLAFGIGNEQPRPISAALLNVIPQSPRITAPRIASQGQSESYLRDLGFTVGEVFGLQRADGTRQIYVALSDGVQQVPDLLGNLIRDEYSARRAEPLVEPVQLRDAPRSRQLDLDIYPETQPALIDSDTRPTICVSRSGTSLDNGKLYALGSVPLQPGARAVTVTSPGSLVVDTVYVKPGRAAVLASVQSTQPSGTARPLFLVTDQGVAYPVPSALALSYLGYGAADVEATSPELIALLPHGPTLDPDTAVRFYPQTGVSARSLPSATAAASGGAQG